MAIVRGYLTLETVKTRLGLTTAQHDSLLESLIEAASREIDGWCGQHFDQVTETRYFTADQTGMLFVDPLVSVTSLTSDDTGDRVYETTWATTDYDLGPYNSWSTTNPYSHIDLAPVGRYTFPTGRKGIAITGVWGWPSVPPPIKEACFLQVHRLFKRRDAPFGVMGSPELGQLQAITSIDPDVRQLLAPYQRKAPVVV